MRTLIVTFATVVAMVASSTATASTKLYDQYACTLQGQVGVTYIVEASASSTILNVCPSLKTMLAQSQLRWGLHAPSFSSGEIARLTWIRRSSRLKITLLCADPAYARALIKVMNGTLTVARGWTHSGVNYP